MSYSVSEINEAIAKAMGDQQVTRYVVRDEAGELVMAFMDGNVEEPAKAQAWIDMVTESGSKTAGWHVVPEKAWPDYLNMTSHAARYINWAFTKQAVRDCPLNEIVEVCPSMSIQILLFSVLDLLNPQKRR